MFAAMLTRLRALLQRRRVARELDAELGFHLEMEIQSNVERGMSPAEARSAALRDFGVLHGAAKKRIAPTYLPVAAVAYLVFYFKQHQPSGAKLVELPDWKLFFLPREGVERFLFEPHQHKLLEYHAAGTVTRLTFPVNTLEEYANAIAQRSH